MTNPELKQQLSQAEDEMNMLSNLMNACFERSKEITLQWEDLLLLAKIRNDALTSEDITRG